MLLAERVGDWFKEKQLSFAYGAQGIKSTFHLLPHKHTLLSNVCWTLITSNVLFQAEKSAMNKTGKAAHVTLTAC